MHRFGLRSLVTIAVALMAVTALTGMPATATQPSDGADSGPSKECSLPGNGKGFASASPNQVKLDPAAVREAIAYANTHLRASVQIFRNNCRVAGGALDPVTDQVPWNVWSSTKSVVSILTGIAADQNRLNLDDQIGKYLPTGSGWGDSAHRKITIRHLLTQTSGLRESAFAEVASTGADPDIVQEALAQPVTDKPGTRFKYGQRQVDLLAYVVERAVKQDLQTFAQRNLFDPIGIPKSSYFWLRDRSGNTYGFAHLFLPPTQYAKLGLLMLNDGVWNGHRVVSSSYVHKTARPTSTNGCYGFLFWTNGGKSCTGANVPNAQTVQHRMIPSAPRDLYAMVGFLQQNNFIIPSLDMTITWTGTLGDTTPNLSGLISAHPGTSDLYYNFFRILMRGVQDKNIPDPGPYRMPPMDFDINPTNYIAPRVLLTDLAPNPQCNLVVCRGTIPTKGLAQNGDAITRNILGTANNGQ